MAVLVAAVVAVPLPALASVRGDSTPPPASGSAVDDGVPAATPGSRPPAAPAGPVLVPTAVAGSTAPAPTKAGLKAALGPLLSDTSLGPSVSAAVLDPATGTLLLDRRAGAATTPASTAKLLTALAVLDALGPDARLATTAVLAPAASGAAAGSASASSSASASQTAARSGPGRLVLVGGGDATLASGPTDGVVPRPASLERLAETTARALDRQGVSRVRLDYDASAFVGPLLAPGWSDSYPALGVVAPVSALMVDGGRAAPGGVARVADPARAAADRFADLLTARGVTVTDVRQGPAGTGATELARVESPTVADLVERMLTESDNTLAEALAHLAGGVNGGEASYAGGARATLATLTDLGIPTAAVDLVDGSGLSRADAVPAGVLVRALAVVADRQPDWAWPVAPGLPVAGLTGTLDNRFVSTATAAAAGVVRAKTGTLTGVSALAGSVRDVDGRVLLYAVLADEVTSVLGAREVQDRISARLAGCGCR
ncbi:MAG: D-alanyl-D-alanine carboxypeptidase/D-alanyl-D-alanine-endopeptidase [Candidatus Nanopelagicales bacterium]